MQYTKSNMLLIGLLKKCLHDDCRRLIATSSRWLSEAQTDRQYTQTIEKDGIRTITLNDPKKRYSCIYLDIPVISDNSRV